MLRRAFGGKATKSERTGEPGRRNHGIGISYDIKVALLVSERRTSDTEKTSHVAEKRSVRSQRIAYG